MYTELECAICYLRYNAGRRCPRELHCKHTFCESCLLALSRALALSEAHRPDKDTAIVCPLCRHTTSISGEEQIRAELRVDECAMEQLIVTGVLLETEEEEPEEGSQDLEEESTPSEDTGEDTGEDRDPSEGQNRGTLRRTLRKVWKKIIGKNADDMRNFALMACYMF
uniref:RING-type domain-containing protein n=1 Tax=Periophthalmus magnuspinnatus TaxID=409849 RepID=A0A3B3ZKA5_9GOBI